jgi:6-phospho-beta-glucosidase
MLPRIALLGGSTPFSAGLFDALAPRADLLGPRHLIVHGRDAHAAGVVAEYGQRRLAGSGWRVTSSTDLPAALDGAALVLHQIRYGGLEGRARAERLAEACGVMPDETLGPAGLYSAIAMRQDLEHLAATLRQSGPDATVLNMTNPLSCSTSLLHRWTSCRVVGLCELPGVTLVSACDVLGVPTDECEWAYAGLNHRGFIHQLTHAGSDQLAALPERLGEQTIGGITAQEIADLGAVPLKYFALFRTGEIVASPSRAQYLQALRAQVLVELEEHPDVSPRSLSGRPPVWYRDELVPMMTALAGDTPAPIVVNVAGDDELVREVQAEVSSAGIVAVDTPNPPAPVADWIRRFEDHERRIVEAVLDPGPGTIADALERDPSVPESRVQISTREVCRLLGIGVA